ncbi:MAG: FAD-dependent oxidoreductase [Candidatus Hodarchaeota archaeon]
MVVWIEAEGFEDHGGWSNDTQFVDVMGSPYLLATGVGKPVSDAITRVDVKESGVYRLWVRTKDWFPSHSPGLFQVIINDQHSPVTFGKSEDDEWRWVEGNTFELTEGSVEIRLHDLTGWWGRCDALVLVNINDDFQPSDDLIQLKEQRIKHYFSPEGEALKTTHDVIVVGGGPAGCAAAIAAARNGASVALIQDRPVLGGNASDEISIPPIGYMGKPPDKLGITGITEELFPFDQGWDKFADSSHIKHVIDDEPNITLFLDTRAIDVVMATPREIKSILAISTNKKQRIHLEAKLFIDCTGHGWIGYYSGADCMIGEESKDQFNESLAPEASTKRTMGNNLYNAKIVTKDEITPFQAPDWAYLWRSDDDFEPLDDSKWSDGFSRDEAIERPDSYDNGLKGKGRNPGKDRNGGVFRAWWVELGGAEAMDIIEDAEKIRDELFRITLGLWDYTKNNNPRTIKKNLYYELVGLNHIMGTRESRRLVGDYILTQNDYDDETIHPDTVAFTDWGIDVHHPEGFWIKGDDCMHVYRGRRVSIPYRSLYSRNISNLFISGRCHSATHLAHGGTREMRTVAMMGEATGTAAALAIQKGTNPRGIYQNHVKELQQMLLKSGCYLLGVKNQDPKDIALKAIVTASSAKGKNVPSNVNNGWNRPVGENSNAWMPKRSLLAKKSKMPHWLILEFNQETEIKEVHITFTKTNSSASLQFFNKGKWINLPDSSTKNVMRRKILSFSPVRASKLKIMFKTPRVGVFEVRVY